MTKPTQRTPHQKMMDEQKGAPPCVPNRFREAIYHTTDDALGPAANGALGKWLYEHRDKLVVGGDERGVDRFNHETIEVDKLMPDLVDPLRKKLIELTSDEDVLRQLATPAFDMRYIEMHSTLYHHGAHFIWHDDAVSYDQHVVPTRRVTFCYYMHTEPKMFDGGELEFMDGTKVEPKNDRLVLFHPVQQHRVRKVECWSAHVLHGRWAIMGWLHGDTDADWVARIPSLRGRPVSG